MDHPGSDGYPVSGWSTRQTEWARTTATRRRPEVGLSDMRLEIVGYTVLTALSGPSDSLQVLHQVVRRLAEARPGNR